MTWKTSKPHGPSKKTPYRHVDIYETDEREKRKPGSGKGKIDYDENKRSTSDITTVHLRGTVVDAKTHAPVPGATIKLRNQLSGEQYEAISDGSGTYFFDGIPPAFYAQIIEASGYIPREDNRQFGATGVDKEVLHSQNAIPITYVAGKASQVIVCHISDHRKASEGSIRRDHRKSHRRQGG